MLKVRSYLSCHSQAVLVNGYKSDSVPLTCGVPQGSVGGPILFSLYLIGLKSILRHHSLQYHIYADDIQVLTSFKPNRCAAASAVHDLEACVQDIHDWLNSHSLKLNLSSNL